MKKPTTECWEFPGHRNDQGYGRVRFQGQLWRAHRLMWYLQKGAIPQGMDVLHACNNPPCTRLDHLYLGTDKDNAQWREHNGHGFHTGSAKVSPEQVVEIRKRREAGETLILIAKDYGLSKAQVNAIYRRRSWKNIP